MSTDNGMGRERWLIGVSVLALGLALFALSAPRFVAYLELAYVPSSFDRALKAGRSVPAPALGFARQQYGRALTALPDDAVLQQDFARIELRRSVEPGVTLAQRHEALTSALRYIRASIVAAPARAFAWSLDALIQAELTQQSGDVSTQLRMSYFLGPQETSSILMRVQVAARLWDGLPEDVQIFVKHDFAKMWKQSEQRVTLIDVYLRSGFRVRSAIRDSLPRGARDIPAFDALLAREIKKRSGS